jgi:3-hydroxyisobutyrate dehydrogenase-like beta-hydroxyacid dehydrogenase
MPEQIPIGFLGIGIMGFQMARRLAEAGYPVQAWNRSRDKVERLGAFGARIMAAAARALGFKADASFEEIVRAHIEDELGGRVVQ